MFTGFGLRGGALSGRQKEVSAGWTRRHQAAKVGDENRGEKGYVVRRVEKALQYSEGAHAVTLRSAQISIQVVGVPHPDGGVTKRKVVTIANGTLQGPLGFTQRESDDPGSGFLRYQAG